MCVQSTTKIINTIIIFAVEMLVVNTLNASAAASVAQTSEADDVGGSSAIEAGAAVVPPVGAWETLFIGEGVSKGPVPS